MGIKDRARSYEIEDMQKGDCLFAATGVTTGRCSGRAPLPQAT